MAQQGTGWNTAILFERKDMAQDDDFKYQATANEAAAVLGETAMAVLTPHAELKKFRISKRESQEKFWGRFGVTQSSGSRF
ncbi:hypothetical protein LP419_36395 [Massilia sp. H-1]|nr:hypothetical protein LP419_36395 [Massilia sp. H-1]